MDKDRLAPEEAPGSYPLGIEEGLTVKQAAELTGMSAHTLRYYERAGLIQPVRRHDSSGHRRYSAVDIAKIETLACLRATGMSLDQMRHYSDLLSQGTAAASLQVALLEAHQRVLEERLREMQRHVELVQSKIAYWRAVESGDERAADIAREFTRRIRADARRSPAR